MIAHPELLAALVAAMVLVVAFALRSLCDSWREVGEVVLRTLAVCGPVALWAWGVAWAVSG